MFAGRISRSSRQLTARAHLYTHGPQYSSQVSEKLSQSSQKADDDGIIVSTGSMFVAYHPDKQHPYEHTKPLPKFKADDSVLKVNSENMFQKSPNLEQLQMLTYTHASLWRQFPGKEKRRKYKEYYDDKDDRPGLTS